MCLWHHKPLRHSDRPLKAWQRPHSSHWQEEHWSSRAGRDSQCGVSPYSVFPLNNPWFLFLRRVEPHLSTLRTPLITLPHPAEGRAVPGVNCSLVVTGIAVVSPTNHTAASPKRNGAKGVWFYVVACCCLKTILQNWLIKMEPLVATDASSSQLSDVWEASRSLSPS